MEIDLIDVIPKEYLKYNEGITINNTIDTKNIYNDEVAVEEDDNINEYNKGIFTTVVRVKGSKESNVVSIKTNKAVHKDTWIEISKALSRLRVGPPLKIGDVICKNILNTGVDIICTRNVNRG
ncbi:hypothetical protein C3495_00075 [Clostridiaceae bacterium 14S0207]|nr:hypothetical protein C3495_00075 [Clostridiaceae bacterium 14S0207]